MLPQGITYREKSATRLRELVRTMPWDKLKALLYKIHPDSRTYDQAFTNRSDVLTALAEGKSMRLDNNSLVFSTPELISKLHGIIKNRPASKPGLVSRLENMISKKQSRSAVLFNKLVKKRTGAGLPTYIGSLRAKQQYKPTLGSALSADDISLSSEIKRRISNLTTLTPSSKIPVNLPYDPSRVVYRGDDALMSSLLPGRERKVLTRFVTPHPDVAEGYARGAIVRADTGKGIIRQYPVKGLKFIAATEKGIPVYTPHVSASGAKNILSHVGSAKAKYNALPGSSRTDYEGVVTKLNPRKSKLFMVKDDKIYPAHYASDAKRIKGVKSKNFANQYAQWTNKK